MSTSLLTPFFWSPETGTSGLGKNWTLISLAFMIMCHSNNFYVQLKLMLTTVVDFMKNRKNCFYEKRYFFLFQFLSQSGSSVVPLHLTSSWKCQPDSTDVTINYTYDWL